MAFTSTFTKPVHEREDKERERMEDAMDEEFEQKDLEHRIKMAELEGQWRGVALNKAPLMESLSDA